MPGLPRRTSDFNLVLTLYEGFYDKIGDQKTAAILTQATVQLAQDNTLEGVRRKLNQISDVLQGIDIPVFSGSSVIMGMDKGTGKDINRECRVPVDQPKPETDDFGVLHGDCE